ncbi:MAG: hypothetical protein NTX53_14970 [candidate division WOR-3 bacterium]|nr:hypothetical protein [candidate division WOR-3 bacterium]
MNRKAVSATVAVWLAGSVLIAAQAAVPAEKSRFHNLWQRWPRVETAAKRSFGPGQDPAAFMIDTSVSYGPASGDQCHPAMASNGSGWLVVWGDSRDYTLRAGRLDANGVLLDSIGITITGINSLPCQADVVFDGVNYLVVWETYNDMYDGDVWAAHISQAGALLDTFVVCAELNGQYNPWVASAGDTSLVVWLDGRNDYPGELYAARVLRSGAVLDPNGFRIAPLIYSYATTHSVEFGGGEFLVAWSDEDSLGQYLIRGARVRTDGTVIDTSAILLRTSGYGAAEPTIAFGDTCFLVAWQEGDFNETDILGTRVTVGGQVLDPSCIQIAPFSNEQEQAAATFDGVNYLVTWLDIDYNLYYQTMRARRVTTGGVPLDPSQIRICPSQIAAGAPAACFNGSSFVVSWDNNWSGADIYCARITSAGAVLDSQGILLPLGVGSQQMPVVAFDGTNYLAVWLEQHDALSDVCGARVTPSGSVIDPKGFTISKGTAMFYDAVAYGAGEYLVVWNSGDPDMMDSALVLAARVTPDGTVLDTTPIRPGTGGGFDIAPDVAFDGTNFLVVWCTPADTTYTVFGARIAPNGSVLDPDGFNISDQSGFDVLPSVAFNGTDYVVTWMRYNEYDADVYCALVSPAGSVVVSPMLVSGASNSQESPAVACGPSSSLIVWMDSRINGSYYDIYAARVSNDGQVLDPDGIPVTNSSYDEGMPEVVYDGSGYQLFWARISSDSANYCGVKLDTAGRTVAQFRPFGQADYSNYNSPLRAASGAPGDVFAVYQSWTDEAGGRQYGNYRVWGKMGPFDGVAETPNAELRTPRSFQTIVRGVLFLPGDRRPETEDRAALLDISGRKVLDLHSGANDVRHLSAGVYFVRSLAGSDKTNVKVLLLN